MARSQHYKPVEVPLPTYRNQKLKELKRDFRISITEEERKHAEELTTEIQIDQFCITMINKYWG